MSIRYMTMAWKMPLNPNETLVLLALADASNDDGFCFPGYDSLIRKTKLARSTLSKTLSILEGSGFFDKQPHSDIGLGRKVNTYQLLFNESWFEALPAKQSKSMRVELIESMRIVLIDKINKLRSDKKKPISSLLGLRKVHSSDTISMTLIHESSIEPSLKQPSLKEKVKKGFVLPEWVDKEIWSQWMIVRKAKKQVGTDIALNGLIAELINCSDAGIPPSEAMTIAIKNSWAGLKLQWIINLQDSNNQASKGNQSTQSRPAPKYIPPEQRSHGTGCIIDSTARTL